MKNEVAVVKFLLEEHALLSSVDTPIVAVFLYSVHKISWSNLTVSLESWAKIKFHHSHINSALLLIVNDHLLIVFINSDFQILTKFNHKLSSILH